MLQAGSPSASFIFSAKQGRSLSRFQCAVHAKSNIHVIFHPLSRAFEEFAGFIRKWSSLTFAMELFKTLMEFKFASAGMLIADLEL
jgi:hypothetical protein